MIVTSGTGWLTTLADLSIILFMITASDLSNLQNEREKTMATANAPIMAEAVAMYRPEPGVVPFETWLASQAVDSRQRVTILVRHAGTDAQAATAAGAKLALMAEKANRSPRLIVEQAQHTDVVALLTYDTDSETLAHNLLDENQANGDANVPTKRGTPEKSE